MFFKKKHFSNAEENQIVRHIKAVEEKTSGEIRVYVESKVGGEDITKRAIQVFGELRMHLTAHKNAVLIYIAKEDRRFAVLGDAGIHHKVGIEFWSQEAAHLKKEFDAVGLARGVCNSIVRIGASLHRHFPLLTERGLNELPDAPVYGV